MIQAKKEDKETVVRIMTEAFDTNKSINIIIKQDAKRVWRIKKIFEYFFDTWFPYGLIYLSEDKKACALVAFPHLKKTTLGTIWLDIKLLWLIGIPSATKGFGREDKIRTRHPKTPFYYLLFIGVLPEHQHNGIGTKLLTEMIADSERRAFPIYLETYLPSNVSLYKKLGFSTFDELDFGFPVYCMKRALT